ncbi:hypothetical protein C2S52_001138 [Perilla frutescens var. hirtella]|nr:hypothetical protein C2S51_007339 [Perilla frutescens var. frutescens]KAH6800674.1 hypothetical protein C2S52_001138 [Perilla frutescens var. hirtella]
MSTFLRDDEFSERVWGSLVCFGCRFSFDRGAVLGTPYPAPTPLDDIMLESVGWLVVLGSVAGQLPFAPLRMSTQLREWASP